MKPKMLSCKTLYSGFFDLREDFLEKSDGTIHSYTSVIIPADAALVIAQTPEGLWVVNREYRHPTGEILLGPAGGRLEKGEEAATGAQRELFEETGYWSDELILVGTCYPFSGVSSQKIFYFWARNAIKKGAQNLDAFEFIETELKTDAELRKEICTSSKVDGNLCTALWYKDQFVLSSSTS